WSSPTRAASSAPESSRVSGRARPADVAFATAACIVLAGYNNLAGVRPWHRRWLVLLHLAANCAGPLASALARPTDRRGPGRTRRLSPNGPVQASRKARPSMRKRAPYRLGRTRGAGAAGDRTLSP